MAKIKDIFTKRWDKEHGFTQKEAEEKKRKVDEAHGVGRPDAQWHPARIVPDPEKKDGFMVTITAK